MSRSASALPRAGVLVGCAVVLLGAGPRPPSSERSAARSAAILPIAVSRAPAYLDGEVGLFWGPTWRCKFDRGLVRMATSTGIRVLDYRLSRVVCGSQVLVDDASPAPRPRLESARTFVWERGPVSEIYEQRETSLKQSFRIHAPLEVDGDLLIRGRIASGLELPPEGTSGMTLCLTRDGEEALTISDAVVYDADGRTIPIAMSFENGELVLRVPEAWMREASFPVTVDPTIGGLVIVDPPAGAGGSPTDSDAILFTPIDIAYNPTTDEYFVVWSELFATLGGAGFDDDFDVWSARIDASIGALAPSTPSVPNPNPIDVDANFQGACAVAYHAAFNRYLTVYEFDAIPEPAEESQIRGRITEGAGGNAPSPNGFAKTTTPANAGFVINADQTDPVYDWAPDVAADATQWLVVWTRDGADTALTGRFVSGVATFNGGSFVVADDDAALEYRPAVAYNPTTDRYLVAFDTEIGAGGEVFALTVTSTGTPGTTQPVSTPGGPEGRFADVAADRVNGEFLVVWEEVVTAGSSTIPADGDIVGRRVDGTTAAAIGGPVNIASGAGTNDGKPRVAGDPCAYSYIITWHRITGSPLTDANMLASRYSLSTLTALETAAVVIDTPAIEFFGAVAIRSEPPQQALVAWLYLVPASPPDPAVVEPQARRFDMPAPPSAPPELTPPPIQSDDAGGASVGPGFVDDDPTMSMRATVSDPDAGQDVRIQVQVVPNGASFAGASTLNGNAVPGSGGVSEVTTGPLARGNYKWRIQAVDCGGTASGWVEFDPGGVPDFTLNFKEKEGANGDERINDTLCGGGVTGAVPGPTMLFAFMAALLLVCGGRRMVR